jgi:membrane protein DedA with SNARE-associated domain
MDLIITLLSSLTPYGHYAYLIMFLILIACGFGLPLPEDIVLVTGGILAGREVTTFGMTFLVTMAGVMIGDSTIFLIGSRAGDRLKKTRFFARLLPPERDAKIQNWYAKYGDKVIFFARFAPGLRMPLFLSAGIYKVPFWKFFLLDGFAALISVPVWIYLGELFGDNLELLDQKIKKLQFGIYGALALVLVAVVVGLVIKKKIAKKIDS